MSVKGISYAVRAGIRDPIAKLILMGICDVECSGYSVIDLSDMAEWGCCDNEIAHEAMQYLEECGFITMEKLEGANDEFHVCIQELRVEFSRSEPNKGIIPPSVRHKVYDRDGNSCTYCNKILRDDERTLDHVVPQAKGGEHTIENLVVACRPCNSSKGTKSLQEWMGRHEL